MWLATLAKWRGILLIVVLVFCFLMLDTYNIQKASKYHSLQQQNILNSQQSQAQTQESGGGPLNPPSNPHKDKFDWATVQQDYPVTSIIPIPTSISNTIPRIQHVFERENRQEKKERVKKLDAVRGNFSHAFEGYRLHAWGRDEVRPISGEGGDGFGGWGGWLVGVLDTLWLMDLKEEFDEAVKQISTIDFSTSTLDEINISQTTIRLLGGLLAAYDISEHLYPELLEKAKELGEMLYKSFDTPNRLPVMHWNFKKAMQGKKQEAGSNVLASEVGSLTLEFTRLSQLTGDAKWFDAAQRVMDAFEEQQDKTKLLGMWPVSVNLEKGDFREGRNFGLGGWMGSLYEYLPKQHMLLGGGSQQYRRLYEYSMTAMKRNIFYRPMTKDDLDILLVGNLSTDGKTPVEKIVTEAQAQHLGCFAGGMVAVGAKIFDNNSDFEIGKQLVEGCLWGYEVMPIGIMPETIHTVPCEGKMKCKWDEKKWHDAVSASYEGPQSAAEKIKLHGLGPGVAKVDDARYLLRPEAIESIFILYRITGDPRLRERAWDMFNTITKYTTTDIAHAALEDCTVANPPKADRLESFWMAETLKYFYLIFEDPSIVSLDDYVFNTEAHPLRRPG